MFTIPCQSSEIELNTTDWYNIVEISLSFLCFIQTACHWTAPVINLPNMTSDFLSSDTSYETGSTINAICSPGYELGLMNSSQTIRCKDGGWDTTPLETCRLGKCRKKVCNSRENGLFML